MNTWKEQLPFERLKAASHYRMAKSIFTQRQNQAVMERSRSFRNLISNSFVTVSNPNGIKYLVGRKLFN